jgi:hypothetical protein
LLITTVLLFRGCQNEAWRTTPSWRPAPSLATRRRAWNRSRR